MRISGDYALDQWARYILTSDFPAESMSYKIQLYAGDRVDPGKPSEGVPAVILRWHSWLTKVQEVVEKGLPQDHQEAVLRIYVGNRTVAACAEEMHVSKRTIEKRLELSRFAVEVALQSVQEMSCIS